MSARREPSSPPVIPGYEHSRILGMGGFADVFLYQQQMPRRSVAVKVLLASSLGDEVRERFRREADVMAQLSHHPSIVTIYQADVAPDGRPYLVMEHCARPGLGQRYRNERMGVAEVLRIGVRLASAVETAHRAGILHRDIKPANVLITDFGWPALTDFGIAATTGWSSGSAVGMSIPWSPPELLAENPTGDVRADVYSLAATVYSLLARRSPFEVPGGSNTAADLIARIERVAPAPTGRGDVPDSLQAVLVRAMDRTPARRHHSALAFARALQQVEAELLLPLTPLDLPEDVLDQGPAGEPAAWPGSADQDPADEGPATRLRPVQSVSPDGPAPTPEVGDGGVQISPAALALGAAHAAARSAATAPPAGAQPGPDAGPAPGTGAAAAPDVAPAHGSAPDGVPEAWRQQPLAATETQAAASHPRRAARTVSGVLGGAVLVGAVVVAGVLALGSQETAPGGDDLPEPAPSPTPMVLAVPSPVDLEASAGPDGDVVFTWENPEPHDGDQYLWGLVVPGSEPALEIVDEPAVTVPQAVPGEPVCVEVSIVRIDRRYSTEPAVGCSD